jgi:2-polyprenyl-6-methoxyphenol hydroxylase-like FAD-dependent oxidoreductase
MTQNGRVMIVGAGIGGLAAAVALERAGRDVVVFEQMDELKEWGAGFTMNSNAVSAVREIGLDKAVEEQGAELRRFVHHTSTGKVLTEWPTVRIAEAVGAPIIGIGRPHVQRILADALGDTEIRFGHQCVGVEQTEDGVTARFANGAEESGSVLVGADGSRSTVRPIYDQTERVYSGYTTWLAYADFTDFPEATHGQWYGRKLILGAHPIGGGKTYWYVGWTAPPGGQDTDAKQTVLDLLGDWADPLPALLQATDPRNIARSDIYYLPRRESWGQGRVTLLGDAAHAMVPALGQGACQAIEDGVILARYLGSADDEAGALRAYEHERIERTWPMVKRARFLGRVMQGDNAGIGVFRNNFFRFSPTKVVLKDYEKFLRFPAPSEGAAAPLQGPARPG